MSQRFAVTSAATVLILAAAAVVESQRSAEPVARGIVFHDSNANGRHDAGEDRLEGIRVSNGREIVRTDARGQYELPATDDMIVFVIKPQGWRTPLDAHNLPRFYYIHKPAGSPKSQYPGVEPTGTLPAEINFPLYPQEEPAQFQAILFGDPQPRDQKELDYIAHDVIEELIGTDASFGVTLGDIMFNDLSLMESNNRLIALLGIPWYNVLGNHDINFDARHDHHSDETFERVYGPAYYSFDYGQVHFLVLDDVEWLYDEEGGKGRYRGGLGERQMAFIRKDLSLIPDDQMVVLMMHIPLVDVEDRHELYRLIEQRPFCLSIAGHTHHHEHRFITHEDGWRGPKPHHHIINVTVCGSWWSGAPDERGIPHATMADGAPNGYSILTFDGRDYTLDFKAAGRPADYQMKIIAPEVVAVESVGDTDFYVNVFNGSPRSRVEFRVGNDEWHELPRVLESDPQFAQVRELENNASEKSWRDLPKPKVSPHLWKGTLPKLRPGTHVLKVRTTDMHGRTFDDERVLRVE